MRRLVAYPASPRFGRARSAPCDEGTAREADHAPFGSSARILLGGLSGATLCIIGNQSVALGAVLGGLGGIAGAFAGYRVRTGLVKKLHVPDHVIALMEDVVAIGGAFLLVIAAGWTTLSTPFVPPLRN